MRFLLMHTVSWWFVFMAMSTVQAAEDWTVLGTGLELREFVIPDQNAEESSTDSPAVLAALRINPENFSLHLGTALVYGSAMTVREWAKTAGFSAAVNAGMFRADDRLRSTGFLRDRRIMVNSHIHPDYGAFLLFDPVDIHLAPVRWLDNRIDAEWESVLPLYRGVVQNYRLISRERKNVWSPGGKSHSTAAIGMDSRGNVLFIHCRPKMTMYEFAQALLDLPLDLVGAMYVEGGADAAMYALQDNGTALRWVGEYRSVFFPNSNTNFWPLPNVLGIRARTSQKEIP